MKSYDEMANDVFHRIDEYKSVKKKRDKSIVRITVSLCCVCLVALLGVGIWQSGTVDPMPPISSDKITTSSESDVLVDASKNMVSQTVEENIKIDNENIVTYFKGLQTGSFRSPHPGEYYCFPWVNAAREQNNYNTDIWYLLNIDLFDENGIATEEQRMDEFKRLSEIGYSFYEVTYWTYYGENGEKAYKSKIVGLFSEAQLQNFDVNEKYGYSFDFITNGNSSPIDFDINAATKLFD